MKFHLGTKKLNKNKQHQKALVRNIAFQSVHKIVDCAKERRAENLTSPIVSKENKLYPLLMLIIFMIPFERHILIALIIATIILASVILMVLFVLSPA